MNSTEIIPNDVFEVIKIFHKKAIILKSHEDFFVNLSLKVNYKEGQAGEVIFKRPDDKTIKAFLMDFRPFYIQHEQINFLSICKALEFQLRQNDYPKLNDKVKNVRKSWNKLLKRNGDNISGGYQYVMHGKKYNDWEIIELWMNGKYFHPTDKKQQKHKELQQFSFSPLEQMAFMSFIDLVQKMAQLIIWLDKNVAEEFLKEYDK